MHYPDDWLQFSEEYEEEVFMHTHTGLLDLWNIDEYWYSIGHVRADFENMLLMGGEMG